MRHRPRSLRPVPIVVLLALLGAACLPDAPSAGRSTPVKRVVVIGDSLTWGLFGTTPGLSEPLAQRLWPSGVDFRLDGGPGDTLQTPWPGHSNWADSLQARINSFDPDVVVIQSVLYPGASNPANWSSYRAAASHLYDIAQSRGAHVYVVRHQVPTNATEAAAADIAQKLQAEAAIGRGISTIPLNWWLDRCAGAYSGDGWHLSANGEACLANALNAAVNQLRNAVG